MEQKIPFICFKVTIFHLSSFERCVKLSGIFVSGAI